MDLSTWYLTTPEPGAPTVKDLRTYAHPRFFHVDGEDLVFAAHAGGGTTRNSTYPRSELRELTDGGHAAWSTVSGLHELSVTAAVTKAPPVKPQVVLAQIHDAQQDVIEVLYDGKKSGGALVVRHPTPPHHTIMQPYALGTYVDVTVRVAGGVIDVLVGGELRDSIRHDGDGCYFKTGCYVQSNPDRGDAPDALGEVRFRRIDPPRHTG